jgi:hypothetical protein
MVSLVDVHKNVLCAPATEENSSFFQMCDIHEFSYLYHLRIGKFLMSKTFIR